MELATLIGNPAAGSELSQLVDQLEKLKIYLGTIKGNQALYIYSKDGSQEFGPLSQEEAEGPRKRFREKVEEKMIEVKEAINKKISDVR